jgi:hypothetical protein
MIGLSARAVVDQGGRVIIDVSNARVADGYLYVTNACKLPNQTGAPPKVVLLVGLAVGRV